MKFLLSISLLTATICFVGLVPIYKVTAAAQDQTKVKIYVVPLKCVLEKINDGINDISSLKPADCKKKINSVSPPPFIGSDGGITAIPLPQYEEVLDEASGGQAAELVVEEPASKISTTVSVPDRSLFAKGVTLVLQAVASVFIILLLGYLFFRRLFGFL